MVESLLSEFLSYKYFNTQLLHQCNKGSTIVSDIVQLIYRQYVYKHYIHFIQ